MYVDYTMLACKLHHACVLVTPCVHLSCIMFVYSSHLALAHWTWTLNFALLDI